MIDAFNPPTVWQPFGAFSMGAAVESDGRALSKRAGVSRPRRLRIVGRWETICAADLGKCRDAQALVAIAGRMRWGAPFENESPMEA